MKSSIIIPTHNKALRLEMVLYSLLKCNDINKCEVIIVDDGSNDNTRDVVSAYENKMYVKYIYQENAGGGKARNTAVLNSEGDILIFIDDDRIVCQNFIEAHINMHEKDLGKIIVIGKRHQLYLANLDKKKQNIMYDIDNGMKEYKKLSRIDDYEKVTDLLFDNNGDTESQIAWISCIFANASIKKNDFIENGMFDEGFKGWGCEDIEVGYRLIRNNVRYVLNRDIVNYHLEHPRNATILEDYKRNFEYMRTKHNARAIDLYWDFAAGKMSLEEYDATITNGLLVNNIENKHLYKHTNMFREKGMSTN